MNILNASLGSSFWNVGSKIGVNQYLFDFFKVHFCQAVKEEIITTDPQVTPVVYPQAMLFKVFESDGRLHSAEPSSSLDNFGKGEAGAIALALERKWVLLVNDRRPLVYARSLGVECVSVPQFCAMLYATEKITLPAAQGYLRRLATTTSAQLLDEAGRVIQSIAEMRGEQ